VATKVRERVRRRLYRDRRPGDLANRLNGATIWLANHGLAGKRLATLEVVGRRSGRMTATPVVVAEYHGARYLVSMLGERSNWVRNVRAAGGSATLRQGGSEPVLLQEIETPARAPILRRYLQVAPGARPHVRVDRHAPLEEFRAVAADYPVFKVLPRSEP
jgi:deazaflavin-dependent oxidoreductase (nitroreductase family)